MRRSSGVLMPISSLPSNYGIGTFGQAAYDFVDWLYAAGQHFWQILPLGPTSYGDSPYQSFSTFAGNPYFIDLDLLIEDGLITKKDVEAENWGTEPRYVDYGQLYTSKFKILERAKAKGWDRDREKVRAFEEENKTWLPNYTLFMACKRYYKDAAWTEWKDKDLRLHKTEACEKYRTLLKEDVELFTYIQYLFFMQWQKLKRYISTKGIEIIGDLPIYVALDSADVWAEPQFFKLDEENYPVEVSGVPPDYFSEDGQLWGNPLYDWDAMERDGFGWWIRRIDGARKVFDVIRIDHFRGFDEYWAVPYGDKTAKNGKWKKGPGMKLIGVLKSWFRETPIEFIAEDLGEHTPTVAQLLSDSGFPGMKVLEFAFDSHEPSNFQPHTYEKNCVCYTGTHDNATALEWAEDASKEDVSYASAYLGISKEEGFNWGLIRGGMSSVADLFVTQMQDYLGLSKYNRINTPGTASGNWQWRMLKGEADKKLAKKVFEITKMYSRL